jgi:hypothetical protein
MHVYSISHKSTSSHLPKPQFNRVISTYDQSDASRSTGSAESSAAAINQQSFTSYMPLSFLSNLPPSDRNLLTPGQTECGSDGSIRSSTAGMQSYGVCQQTSSCSLPLKSVENTPVCHRSTDSATSSADGMHGYGMSHSSAFSAVQMVAFPSVSTQTFIDRPMQQHYRDSQEASAALPVASITTAPIQTIVNCPTQSYQSLLNEPFPELNFHQDCESAPCQQLAFPRSMRCSDFTELNSKLDIIILNQNKILDSLEDLNQRRSPPEFDTDTYHIPVTTSDDMDVLSDILQDKNKRKRLVSGKLTNYAVGLYAICVAVFVDF